MCGAAAWALSASIDSHFSTTTKVSGPSLACTGGAGSASTAGPYSAVLNAFNGRPTRALQSFVCVTERTLYYCRERIGGDGGCPAFKCHLALRLVFDHMALASGVKDDLAFCMLRAPMINVIIDT